MQELFFSALLLLVCQEGTEPQDSIQKSKQAVNAWLQAKADDEKALERAVDAIAGDGRPALVFLADLVRRAEASFKKAGTAAAKRLRALDSLIARLGLRWLDRVAKSGMFYAGQYDELRLLQPRMSTFYLRLLLDTPAWFPDNMRDQVVPALRDLYPKSPGKEVLEQIEEIARNDEIEPLALRQALAYALAQWGRRELARQQIHRLEKTIAQAGEDVGEEAGILARKELATVYYALREYQTAAQAHRDFLTAAKAAKHYTVPVDYYNAACCMCLSGDRRTAMTYIERALELNSSTGIDSSVRLRRKLFEKDPEIAGVRSSKQYGERFKELMRKAFGESTKQDKKN